MRVERLRARREFLRVAADGRRWITPAFVVQVSARPNAAAEPAEPTEPCAGLGFTVTKRIGKAVTRNRARRRLKASAACAQDALIAGHDYVVVAREDALMRDFHELCAEMRVAFARAPTSKPKPPRPNKRRASGRGS